MLAHNYRLITAIAAPGGSPLKNTTDAATKIHHLTFHRLHARLIVGHKADHSGPVGPARASVAAALVRVPSATREIGDVAGLVVA